MKYIIKLDETGYYHPDSFYKPVEKIKAFIIEKRAKAESTRCRLRRCGYTLTKIEKVEK